LLATRVATAVVGIPIIFGLIWIGGWPYAIVAAIVLAVAAAEFFSLRYDWRSFDTANICASVVAIALAAGYSEFAWAVALPVAIVWAFVTVTGPIRAGKGFSTRRAIAGTSIAVTDVVYLGALGSTILLLRELDNGRDWVYLALFSTFAVDTAAYFVGRAIGRHRLAPSISPKKTWEGFFGGYAGGIAAVLLLNYFLGLRIDVGPALLIALTLPVAAALGDLFESWIKRRAGVKDASELIPGHGGVLDRLDSVLLTFPLVYVVARWIA
jgi:phosphatidate cytidylyltransferase